MSLTQAMKEAYAEPGLDDVIYDTLELNHESFAEPVRIIANVEENRTLAGQLYTAMGVMIQLTGFDDDGQTSGQVQIENVSSLLVPYLEAAVKAGSPIAVTYRGFLKSNPGAAQEVRGGLFLSKVRLNATSASGTLEGLTRQNTQAFPRLIYSVGMYPGLHGA